MKNNLGTARRLATKRVWLHALGAVAAALFTAQGCSDAFRSSCAETKTCSRGGAGGMEAGAGPEGGNSPAAGQGGSTGPAQAGAGGSPSGGASEAGQSGASNGGTVASTGGTVGVAAQGGSTTMPDDGEKAGVGGEGGSTSGTLNCRSSELACGGTCVDPDTDAKHCGACGHDCLGGTCLVGTCQPVTLATKRGSLNMVQLSGDYIYYGGGGADVRRIKKDGTGDVVLAPAVSDDQREFTYTWALTPTALLWANDWVNKAVRGCALPDCVGGPQDFVGTSTFPIAVTYALANSTVYFGDGLTIKAKPWPGGTLSDFAVGKEPARSLIADSAFLYWDTPSGVHKRALLGGPTIDLVTGRQGFGYGIAVTRNTLYWSEGSSEIFSTPLPNGSGGAKPKVVGEAGGQTVMIAANSTHVYWTALFQVSDTGIVVRCPLDGCSGAPEVMANTIGNAWGVALDEHAAYWVTTRGELAKVRL